ncbi:transposase, partial [Candidatus Micrarchaeota archaeon]|nr:transposase [Candidatus Micrarchaeota archaeon]
QARFKDFLFEKLHEIARRLGVGVVEVGIQDNHVHIVADLQSWQSPSWVLERLKGESSYALFDVIGIVKFR